MHMAAVTAITSITQHQSSPTSQTLYATPLPAFINATTFSVVSTPDFLFARTVYLWLVPVMVAVLSVAVFGNGIIVFSARWLSRPINPYNRLCVSLAAADTWAASLLAIGLMFNSYLPVVMGYRKKTDCVAAILEIFRVSGMLTSNLHIFALALHQFVGIVYPLKYKMILTTKRQRLIITMLWIVPLLFILLWFIVLPNEGFRNNLCRHNFYTKLPFRLSVFVSFIIPLLATFALYAHILVTLMKAKALCDTDLRRSMHHNYKKKVESKLKLVWTTLLILSTFTLSWGLCVLNFVLVCKKGCMFIFMKSVSFKVGFLLNSTVNFLVMIKLVLNPLIYALRMRHIRNSVLACFHSATRGCFYHFKPVSSALHETTINGILSERGDLSREVSTKQPRRSSLREDILMLSKKPKISIKQEVRYTTSVVSCRVRHFDSENLIEKDIDDCVNFPANSSSSDDSVKSL